MPVEKIGRYRIDGELGKGAMGVVYKATDPTIGRTVALKTMRVDVAGEQHDDMLGRLRNEARAAGLLTHPNIVTIYDAGEDQDMFYIAMEYIEGESLASLLAKKRSLSAQEVVELGNQICAGLQYAHTKKVVHRDIKPANIMLASAGGVKITDFGIAKAGASLTHTGEVVGTPHYMSPEQIKGRPLDGRSDLFSTGVVLYEMITGEKPFNAPAVTSVIYKIVNDDPIPPREMDVTIHPGLSLVITKCLAKDPDERYQDAADLSTALRSYKIISIPEPKPAAPAPPPPLNGATRIQTRPIVPPAGTSSPSTGLKAAAAKSAPVPEPPRKAVETRTSGAHIGNKALLVGGIAVLLLVSFMAVRSFRSKSSPPEAQLPDRSDVPAAASATTSPPSKAPPQEHTAQQQAADEAETLVRDAEVKGDRAAVSGVGDLRITSSPSGAQVTVDGVSQEWYVTPFNTPPMKAGTHTVTASAPGLPSQTRTVEVTARKKTVVNFQLAGENAIFNIDSTPAGAAISVDGQSTGTHTPAQLALGPGSHRIALKLEGFEPEEFVAEAAAGSEVNFAPKLRARNSVDISAAAQPDTLGLAQMARMRRAVANGEIPEGMGAVQIRTRPRGATVTVENRQLGRMTPFRLPVRPGSYTVTISKPGYKSVTRAVQVEEGKLVELNELLLPQR